MGYYSKGKIVGFLVVIGVLILLVFVSLKIVSVNKEKQRIKSQYVTYKNDKIDAMVAGEVIEYVSLGADYNEQGVIAYSLDTDISDDVIISYFKDGSQVELIDTDSIGNYLVEYIIMDDTNKKKIYKTVIVVDNKKPSITFPKKTVIKTEDVFNYDLEADVTSSDNSGKVKLTYDGILDEKEGSYVITYTAVDSAGNKVVKKRLIKVIK